MTTILRDAKGHKLAIGSYVRFEREGRKRWHGEVISIDGEIITIKPSRKDFLRTVELRDLRVIRYKPKKQKHTETK